MNDTEGHVDILVCMSTSNAGLAQQIYLLPGKICK